MQDRCRQRQETPGIMMKISLLATLLLATQTIASTSAFSWISSSSERRYRRPILQQFNGGLIPLPITTRIRTRQQHFPAQKNRPNLHRGRLGMALMDPSEVTSLIRSNLEHFNALQETATSSTTQHAQTIVSWMYSVAIDVRNSKPAHGHGGGGGGSWLFGGLPDPYVTAGKSIAPTVSNFVPPESTTTALADQAQAAFGGGGDDVQKVQILLDGHNIVPTTLMPGQPQSLTGMIEPPPASHDRKAEVFVEQVLWSYRYLNIYDRLPYIAGIFAFVDFFLLRAGWDWYKEEIDTNPRSPWIEATIVTSVRCTALVIITGVVWFLLG